MMAVEISDLLRLEVKYPGYHFKIVPIGEESYYLQIMYIDNCVVSGKMEWQYGRKWFVSQHATKSEIVRTALKAALTSAEHNVRERFTYRGKRIFGPHFDVDKLAELCDSNCTDERKPE